MTIRPTIIRKNYINATEYYVLRVTQHYRWCRDELRLTEELTHVKRAIDYACCES
jgi:hypothetical protein